MTTEDRRKLIEKLEYKQLANDAQDGRNVELTKEINMLYDELYPDGDDEDTCSRCGVTYVEMCNFDDYQAIKEQGSCRVCQDSLVQGAYSPDMTAHLIARLMAAIETPGDLTPTDVDDLLEDAHDAYEQLRLHPPETKP